MTIQLVDGTRLELGKVLGLELELELEPELEPVL